MKKIFSTIIFIAITSLSLTRSSVALGSSSDDARAVRDAVYRAKSVVDRALGDIGPDPARPTPGPGQGPWSVEDLVVTENDSPAVPIYQQSSQSLFDAGSYADRAIIALSSGERLDEGVYLFAQSCAKMALARSQIARANLAAAQPPVGLLVQFGPELKEIVVELNELHRRCR